MKLSQTLLAIVFLGVQLACADNHDDHHNNPHPAPEPEPKEVNRVTLNGVTYINKVCIIHPVCFCRLTSPPRLLHDRVWSVLGLSPRISASPLAIRWAESEVQSP